MTTQQEQIQFTIQTLEGETFQVSIPLSEAEKTWTQKQNECSPAQYSCSHCNSFYEQHGLDSLKDAIHNHNGTANAIQQLICQEELTISTPLIPLATSVITLIVMVPFRIDFQQFLAPHINCDVYALLANLDHFESTSHTHIINGISTTIKGAKASEIVTYLHLYRPPNNSSFTPSLRVIGKIRDYFKIATADLSDGGLWDTGGVLRNTYNDYSCQPPYQITDDTPSHVWLKFDEVNMKIVE